MELNDFAMQQMRIAHMRFLGELYNYEHVDSSVIFDTLYLILVFGHGTSEVIVQYFVQPFARFMIYIMRLASSMQS